MIRKNIFTSAALVCCVAAHFTTRTAQDDSAMIQPRQDTQRPGYLTARPSDGDNKIRIFQQWPQTHAAKKHLATQQIVVTKKITSESETKTAE